MNNEINRDRCQFYADLFQNLADGTHTVEAICADGGSIPEKISVCISLCGDEVFSYRAVPIRGADKDGIDWDVLPSWAQWVAMDKDGSWYHYGEEPHRVSDGWASDNAYEYFYHPLATDWTKSLQSRPVA